MSALKNLFALCLATLALVVAPVSTAHAQAQKDPQAADYRLDAGDKLRIIVFGEENLTREFTVSGAGDIAFPLIGQVPAAGRTVADLQAAIRAKLADGYLRDPRVSAEVLNYRPFFILGEVKLAGQYPYVSGMTVETAIAIAGGYTERASHRSFRLSRRINGFIEMIDVPSDYVVQPGDTVYVHERFF